MWERAAVLLLIGLKRNASLSWPWPAAAKYSEIRLAVKVGLEVNILSNFTVSEAVSAFDVPARSLSFLVNVNDRDSYSSEEWHALVGNIESAQQRGYSIVLGYTAHTGIVHIPHIIEIGARFKVAKLRISPSKPTIGGTNTWLAPDDMLSFSESVMALYQILHSVGIRLVLDCPIPFCHIPEQFLHFFLQELRLSGTCGFGSSVNVNLDVGHCYITNSLLTKRNLRTFATMEEIRMFTAGFASDIDKSCPLFDRCTKCHYFILGSCSAGCYGIRHECAPLAGTSHV